MFIVWVLGLGSSCWANPAWLCVPDHKAPFLSLVVFRMSFVQGEEYSNKIPVVLCIKKNNLYLSCVLKDGKPTLQLEVSEYQGLKVSQAPLRHSQPSFISKTTTFSALKIWECIYLKFCINVNTFNVNC